MSHKPLSATSLIHFKDPVKLWTYVQCGHKLRMFPNRNILGSESHLEYFADPFLTFHVRIKISHQKEPAKQKQGGK